MSQLSDSQIIKDLIRRIAKADYNVDRESLPTVFTIVLNDAREMSTTINNINQLSDSSLMPRNLERKD
ncbi:MAG: hypothetical protein JKY50_07325 [Oleispira sp.]|nr:hypothetical protein [Oleispira sp.]MBL4881188.1 hypothetical protein [Oleispira sp.]